MVEYILGNYLVANGKITAEQLENALVRQDCVRAKLDLIAVAEGMLTLEQADEINRLLADPDEFGNIAIAKGFLNEAQVSKLSKKRGNGYMMFIQALVDSGYLPISEIDSFVDEFRRANHYSHSEMDALKSDNADRIVPLFIPGEGSEFIEIVSLVINTAIRLIDRHIYIGKAEITDVFPSKDHVSQTLVGWSGMINALSEGDGALLTLASIFAQEEFEQLDQDALDAAGEFLNSVNGLYASSLSSEGCFLELSPPDYGILTTELNPAICKVPLYIGSQCFYFTAAKAAY
ncbi:MAG: hypothetical protein J6C33_07850 [Lachnospiraceae bacterium]|nr:hypothetical protein [Lachnospiraceae bacterium]